MSAGTTLSLTDADGPLAVAGHFLHEAPVDVFAMAAALGLTVDASTAMSSALSGRIIRDDTAAAGYHIELNGAHSYNRRRFTLAHEIAHFLLHTDLLGNGVDDTAQYRSTLAERIEVAANALATRILMPATLVRNVFQAGVKSPSSLSVTFQVPEEVMRIRLKQLGLVWPLA